MDVEHPPQPDLARASRLAMMLAGDRVTAQRLVATSFLRGQQSTAQPADGQLGFSPLVVDVLRRFIFHRGSWVARSKVTAGRPFEPMGLSERQTRLLARMDALHPRQRALVALRFAEQVTIAEIASVLEMAPKIVLKELTNAVDELATELSLSRQRRASHPEPSTFVGDELSSVLEAVAAQAPSPQAIQRAIIAETRIIKRASQRTMSIAAVTAAAVLLVVAVPTLVLPSLPGTPRVAGAWHFFHQVHPPAGWQIGYRRLTAADETVSLTRTFPDASSQTCTTTVSAPGLQAAPPTDADPEPVRVHRRPGMYFHDAHGTEFLRWQYAANATAEVSCEFLRDRKLLFAIASSWVTFEERPVSVPLRIEPLSGDYQVGELFLYDQGGTTEKDAGPVSIRLGRHATDAWTLTIDIHKVRPSDRGRAQDTGIRFHGRRAFLSADGTVGCLEADEYVCVTAFWPQEPNQPSDIRALRRLVLVTLDKITVADSLADRSTWFDADSAIP